MTTMVLDSFAVLAFLNKEGAATTVFNQFTQAENGMAELLMSAVNVGEVYYILAKRKSMADAKRWGDEMMHALPIQIHSPNLNDVLRAADLKATYPISYADAFAASLALRHNCGLMTGDPEFRSIPKLQLDWIGM